jgi:hypothetical protein
MLVICNGAFKSGSTWISQIVAAHGRWAAIPECYQNPKWTNPSISDDAHQTFFENEAFDNNDYFCKQHWPASEKYLGILENPNCKMLNIKRDLRDVLVSRYFHDVRGGVSNADSVVEYYYKDKGKVKLQHIIDYHKKWHKTNGNLSPFLCSYENLLVDFRSEAEKIFAYLETETSEKEIMRIQKATAFSSKKSTGEGQFFRKGESGDWVNHLNDEVVEDIDEMAKSLGYTELFADKQAI